MCDAARRENGRRGMQKTAKLEEGQQCQNYRNGSSQEALLSE